MSVFYNNALAGASGQGGATYKIERSLRFNSADAAYLSRTPASAGNRKTWTWSGWVKRTALGSYQSLFATTGSSGAYTVFQFTNSNTLEIYSNSAALYFITSAVFRDTSAWMHLLFSVDTTAATSTDRFKFYVNGTQVTAFSTQTYPSQNLDTYVNSVVQHTIGQTGSTYYLNGYLADVHLIDGQALTPSSFGETDTNGVWQPKAYSGTYGTNGFRLDFSDNSAATATTLGKDRSPNGNNWTPTNLSVTAGAGNDSLTDTPTSYGTDTGVGAEVRGNYATLNPLNSYSAGLSNGNLQLAQTTTSWVQGNSTIGVSSGKWYWEVTWSSGTNPLNGITKSPLSSSYVGSTSDSWGYAAGSSLYNSGSSSSYGSNLSVGDVIGVALNLDAGTLVFYKNGVSQGQAASGLSGTFFAAISVYGTTSENINFGQRPFAYTAPSGFKALCTQNLPTPTITKGSSAMDVVLYTGTGSALTPTSTLGFSPDLVWIKGRSASTDNALYDTVRGATIDLVSNSTAAETTQTQGLTAFNSNGFSVGTLAKVNTNTATYAAWAWDAGSSTVTNTSGSISSQVRANASAGFSVVTYTGTGANATVGHGLGVAPQFIIVKARSAAYNWQCYHISLGAASGIQLNLTNASAGEPTFWNSTAPTSTVFSVGTSVGTNESTKTYVAYCFTPVAGYSAFGSYTGNGSADGPMVFCNFRPRWVMIKASSASGSHWLIIDATRSTYNQTVQQLYANLASAEDINNSALDLLANGFKCRADTFANINGSGTTYIWAAFAEHPFSLARAR